MLNETQGRIALVVAVLVVLGLAYFLWNRSAPPVPTVPANQSLQDPFGGQAPPPPGPARGRPPGGP